MDVLAHLKSFLLDLLDWLYVVVRQLWGFLSGVAIGFAIFLYEHFTAQPISWTAIQAVLYGGVIVSSFLAWREERHKVQSTGQSKHSTDLLELYRQGCALSQALGNPNVTDEEIKKLDSAVSEWFINVQGSVGGRVGDVGIARLNDTSADRGSYSFRLNGQHEQSLVVRRNQAMNLLARLTRNLDDMASTTQYDSGTSVRTRR